MNAHSGVLSTNLSNPCCYYVATHIAQHIVGGPHTYTCVLLHIPRDAPPSPLDATAVHPL
jgi:hypothetical protein